MKRKEELLKRVDELLMQKQELDVDSKEARAIQSDINEIMKIYNDLEANDLKAEELQIKKQQELAREVEARREAELKQKEIEATRLDSKLTFAGKLAIATASVGSAIIVYLYEKVDIFPAAMKNLQLKLRD